MTTTTILGGLLIASVALACLFTAGLARAAAKTPPPMPHPEDLWGAYFDGGPLPTLADRMAAARGPVSDPVAEAIAIKKAAAL